MKVLIFFALLSTALADIIQTHPDDCGAYPCERFRDDFTTLDDGYFWEHTMSAGNNFEFQVYSNNRTTSFVKNGILHIKAQLFTNIVGTDPCTNGFEYKIRGVNGIMEGCTSDANWGCAKTAMDGGDCINAVFSARINTRHLIPWKFVNIEVRAKMPEGDWLWPAIWMLPYRNAYGYWPASGEIDIVEAKGNRPDTFNAASTMHWGPFFAVNRYFLTTAEYQNDDASSFADNFHVWRLEWTSSGLDFLVDDVLRLSVTGNSSFWDLGGFASLGIANPWIAGTDMAPFDQDMYLIMNLAVGGTNGFFPDGLGNDKPWMNNSTMAIRDFWNARNDWMSTWGMGADGIMLDDNALQIDYVIVTQMSANP